MVVSQASCMHSTSDQTQPNHSRSEMRLDEVLEHAMDDAPSVTLYTQTRGAAHAETIVFLPGFAGSHTVWNSDFHALSAQYRLIFIDTLGFGRSPKPAIEYS